MNKELWREFVRQTGWDGLVIHVFTVLCLWAIAVTPPGLTGWWRVWWAGLILLCLLGDYGNLRKAQSLLAIRKDHEEWEEECGEECEAEEVARWNEAHPDPLFQRRKPGSHWGEDV